MTLDEFYSEWNNGSSTLTVHTSGSTGKPKDIVIEKAKMLASARMTCDALHLAKGDTALLCMPLDYIAGKMMVVRSIERELNLISVEPSSHPLKAFAGSGTHIHFTALVPLQVTRILEDDDERAMLESIDNVIIGGGAIDEELEEKLKSFHNNIFSTYGMTETLSHIALRRISGSESSLWYTPMNGVGIYLTDDNCLTISAPHLCDTPVITNDIAEISLQGQFRIIGRKDNTINTGGVKVQTEEMEDALRKEGVKDFMVTSVKDAVFGEAITLLLEGREADDATMKAIAKLPKYCQPKHIITVSHLPLTETGKPNRAKAKEMAANELRMKD